MGRPPLIPSQLTQHPFTTADARRAGLRRWHLEGATWRRLGAGIYVSDGIGQTPMLELQAAWARLPPTAAFSGLTAAWLHGLDVMACDPIEVIVPEAQGVSARSGLAVRRAVLGNDDVVMRRGFRATSILRTLRDLSCRLSLIEAVVIADMATHARLIGLDGLNKSLPASAGLKGVARLRRVLCHTEPASESPMETRLRMLLISSGLPRPGVQVPIYDAGGRILGRIDLYYRAQRLGLEYDGGSHRTSLVEDNRRQNRLLDAGVRLLRFTAGDLFNAPQSVVNLVRTVLGGSSVSA